MKIMKKMLLLAMTGLMVFQLVACSNKSGKEFEITTDEFNTVLEQYKARYKEQVGEDTWNSKLKDDEEFNSSLQELVLEQVILEKVLMDEATTAKIEVTDEEVNTQLEAEKANYATTEEYETYLTQNNYTEETFKEELKKQLTLNKLLQSKAEEIMKLEPSDKELKELYDKDPSAYNTVQASHILVATEDLAKEIKTKIDNGEDFAALAKEYSIDSSAESGGDLGYFTASDMIEEFSSVAFSLSVGEVSDPVQSSYGYHIIKVTDKKDTYEKADNDNLVYQYKSAKYNEMLDNYVNNANVKMPKELQEIRDRSKEK